MAATRNPVLLAALLLAFPAETALAQAPDAADAGGDLLPAATLTGLIRSRGNRNPISGAFVLSEDAGFLAATNAAGEFSVQLAEPGATAVRVRAVGFLDAQFREELHAGETLRVIYSLEPREVNPYQTVVRDERQRTEVSRVHLAAEELRTVPGTAGDPFRAILLLPGVSNAMSGTAFPIIRGSEPTSTGYFIDGVRVPQLFHLYLGPSAVHPDLIESIDFYPGGAPAQYGRLLGGAIEGRIAEPHQEGVHATAYADLINLGAFIDVPIEKTGTHVSLSGRFSYTGWLIEQTNFINKALGDTGQTVLDFYDYQARVEQKLGPGRLRLFAFGSSDASGTNTGSDLTTSVLEVAFNRVDLRYRMPLGPGEAEVGLTWGVDRVTQVGADGKNDNYVDLPGLGLAYVATTRQAVWEPSYRARVSWKARLASDVTASAGADVDHLEADVTATRVSVDPTGYSASLTLPGAFGTLWGAWAQAAWEPSAHWQVVPGLRFDDYHLVPGIDRPVAEPRLSARYAVADGLVVKGAAGLYHQVPASFVNLPAIDLAGLQYGLEEGLQFDAGVEWKTLGSFELGVDAYFHSLLQTIDLTIDTRDAPENCDPAAFPQGPCVIFPSLAATRSHGYAYGVELLARRALGRHWYGWVSLTLQRSMRWTAYTLVDAAGNILGQGQRYLPFAYDQTFVGNAVLSYAFSNGWRAGAALHFNTGRPNSGTFPSSVGVNEYLTSYTYVAAPNGTIERLPPFFRVDLRVAKTWLLDLLTLEAYLDVLNATVSEEVLAIQADRQPIGVRLILPVLGVKGSY